MTSLVLVVDTNGYSIANRFVNGKDTMVLNVLGMDAAGSKYQITAWGQRARYVKEHLE